MSLVIPLFILSFNNLALKKKYQEFKLSIIISILDRIYCNVKTR